MDNIIVRIIDLPLCVKGVTVPHPDGTYNIFINAKFPIDIQRQTIKHELKHVSNMDFESIDDIKTIENRASNF